MVITSFYFEVQNCPKKVLRSSRIMCEAMSKARTPIANRLFSPFYTFCHPPLDFFIT